VIGAVAPPEQATFLDCLSRCVELTLCRTILLLGQASEPQHLVHLSHVVRELIELSSVASVVPPAAPMQTSFQKLARAVREIYGVDVVSGEGTTVMPGTPSPTHPAGLRYRYRPPAKPSV